MCVYSFYAHHAVVIPQVASLKENLGKKSFLLTSPCVYCEELAIEVSMDVLELIFIMRPKHIDVSSTYLSHMFGHNYDSRFKLEPST